MRLVFLGTGAIGVPSLQALAASGRHEIVAVVTQPDKPAGRDLRLRPSAVKQVAIELGLPVLQPRRARDSVDELKAAGADVFVVIAYGQLLPPAILGIPPLGCLNVHASLLPRHRGASPVHAAILSGDALTGVTVMQMDEGLDTGDILTLCPTPVGPRETCGELHDRLALLAVEPLVATLDDLAVGRAVRTPQNAAEATLCGKLTRDSGRVDWARPTEEVDRFIRGMSPWPGAWTSRADGGEPIKIHRASPSDAAGLDPGQVEIREGMLFVGTGDGAMHVEELQLPSRKRMLAADFLRGNRDGLGTRWS